MLRAFFFFFLFSCLVLSQEVESKITYVPGEIIIKYEKYGSKSKGSAILSEHDFVVKKLNTALPAMAIISYKPVFNKIITGMVTKNLTERELNESESGNTGFSKPLSHFQEPEFSTTLLLKTGKNG